MRKDSDETIKMTRPDNNELQFQKSENKENLLESALLRGLIRKRVLKNPRYLLVIRRLRYLAYCAAKENGKKEKMEEMPGISDISKYIKHLDLKKIFSN